MPDVPFERTTCGCDKCKAPCRTMPGYLIPEDLQPLADFLGMSRDEMCRQFLREGAGAKALIHGQPVQHASITPKIVDGACVFFDKETGNCKIHPVSPFGCRYFTVCSSSGHTKADEQERMVYGWKRVEMDALAHHRRALRILREEKKRAKVQDTGTTAGRT